MVTHAIPSGLLILPEAKQGDQKDSSHLLLAGGRTLSRLMSTDHGASAVCVSLPTSAYSKPNIIFESIYR